MAEGVFEAHGSSAVTSPFAAQHAAATHHDGRAMRRRHTTTAAPCAEAGRPQTQSVAGITVAELLGTVGGNLGMFTGMSFMTILELFEVGAGGASWPWGRGARLGVRGGAGRGLDCT